MADPELDLLFVAHGHGVLESCDIEKVHYRYRRYENRWRTLFSYIASQVMLFLMLWKWTRSRPATEKIYVNTALPFGAALFGRVTGRPVIYHLHEVSVTPRFLQLVLWGVVRLTATEMRFVSHYHQKATGLSCATSRVIYNCISQDLESAAHEWCPTRRESVFSVTMLSTLRDYKGIPEFIELARTFVDSEEIQFKLVANDDSESVAAYISKYTTLPKNLVVLPQTADLAPIYREANLVVNFSRQEEWIETFGLTLLEAMMFGVPVIAPPVGGPVEVLGEGLSDYLISGHDVTRVSHVIKSLSNDHNAYIRISALCRERALKFSRNAFIDSVCN
jgi:glycosyltransferase involved in cell wall biosynthesis